MKAKEIRETKVWQLDLATSSVTEKRLVDIIEDYAAGDLKNTTMGVCRAMYVDGNTLVNWVGVRPSKPVVREFATKQEAEDAYLELYYDEICEKGDVLMDVFDTYDEVCEAIAKMFDTLEAFAEFVIGMGENYNHDFVIDICQHTDWECETDDENYIVASDDECIIRTGVDVYEVVQR